MTNPALSPSLTAVPARRRWRLGIGFILGAGFLFLSWQIYYILIGPNFHEVLPGRVFRGAQPSPERVEQLVRQHGIRTIINLRGFCYSGDTPWYLNQCRAVENCGITQEDVGSSACRLPPAQEMRRLVEVLDRAEHPVYIHCRRGADRTGLACGLLLLLHTDATLAEVRGQLHWRYGHVPLGRPLFLDQFFDLYESWLEKHGKTHAKDVCRHWVLHEYNGGWCQYRIDDFTVDRRPLSKSAPSSYRVRFRNVSERAWQFTTHSRAGIHVAYVLKDDQNKTVSEGRAGFFERTVAPGETVDVLVVLPTVPRAGKYRLVIDLAEEGHLLFYQAGAEPLEQELEVREETAADRR